MYSHMWLPIQMEHERETIFSLNAPHNISLPLQAGPPEYTRESSAGQGDLESPPAAVPGAI